MIIRTKKTWKELCDNTPAHAGTSRREFLERGLATGFMSVCLSNLFIKTALASELNCPPPNLVPGGIAQIFSEGGPTMGARFISDAQAGIMNATMAANYGISGQANLIRIGPNLVVDRTSPFGFTLLQGPPGYPGGAAAWKTNVLNRVSGGGHLGPFSADDGAGVDSGLVAGISPFKPSLMGKDLKVNVSNTLAPWAEGLPAASVAASSPANFAKTFTLSPPAQGLINSESLDLASVATTSIADAFARLLKNGGRKGADNVKTAAGCGFFQNSNLANPNYGNTLFNPAGISALTNKVNVGALSTAEQGLLAAYFQSAAGVAGGVITQFSGRDYHQGDPQTTIAPKDIEEARAIVMFLAACEAARAPGAMIYLSNGQAIASGVAAVTATINGNTVNMNAPKASGDAGGTYNAGLIIFFSPDGSPPAARFTGTVDTNGSANSDSNVASAKEAVAGLYLSAISWINNSSVPGDVLAQIQKQNLAANPAKTMVI